MGGRRRRTRPKEWRPPLVPFNKLPLCPFCGTEMGMQRPRRRACIVCVADWPDAGQKRKAEPVQQEKPVRSLKERLRS